MGARISTVTKFPRLLTSSLQRLRERHEYLLKEGYLSSHSYISENKLRAIVLPSDNEFVYRITKTKMKEFRDFQAEVKKKYSVDPITDEGDGTENEEDNIDGFKSRDEFDDLGDGGEIDKLDLNSFGKTSL